MKVISKIKQFIVDNGLTSLAALFVSVYGYFHIHSMFIGTAALFFCIGRNWEIISKYIKKGFADIEKKF